MADEHHACIESEPEQTITVECEKDESPSSPERPKWQETLISLVAAHQQQLMELTRQCNMAASSSSSPWPTPSVSVAPNLNAQAHVASPLYPSPLFKLTDYDPDSSAYSIEEWLADATKLKQELCVSDNLMIARASEALKNRGYRHCCDWRPRCRTWENFCADLVVAFPDKETPGARAYKAATLRSSDCDSLCEYGTQKLRRISRFHDKLPWNTTLSMIEYGLDDAEARSALHIQKPNSDRELLQLLSEFDARSADTAKVARPMDITVLNKRKLEHRPPNKGGEGYVKATRFIKGACFNCGRHGHRQKQCNVQKQESPKQAPVKAESANVPTCSHCKKMGHTELNCWYKHGKPKRAFLIKK